MMRRPSSGRCVGMFARLAYTVGVARSIRPRRPSKRSFSMITVGAHLYRLLTRRQAVCGGCAKPYGLQRCSSCKIIKFCSRDCQKSAWKFHKQACQQKK
jgi:hypothetical protein